MERDNGVKYAIKTQVYERECFEDWEKGERESFSVFEFCMKP